jgi:hypothetical protein
MGTPAVVLGWRTCPDVDGFLPFSVDDVANIDDRVTQ